MMKRIFSIRFHSLFRRVFLVCGWIFLICGLPHTTRAQSSISIEPGYDTANPPEAASEAVVAGDGSAPGQNSTGANVNTFTGDAQATATDFNYSRNGFAMKFERYFHNGITSPFNELGQGWMNNWDLCLYVPVAGISTDHALLVTPQQVWRFPTPDGGNTFTAPSGCFYQLQVISGSSPVTYALTDRSGYICKFTVLPGGEPNIARLVEMDDLNGNKVILSYQACTLFTENYIVIPDYDDQTTFTPQGWPPDTNPNYCPQPQTFVSTYQTLRLSNVMGPNNNWYINFGYYDNLGSPSMSVTSGWGQFSFIWPTCGNLDIFSQSEDVTLNSPYSNKLASVTNSAGDVLTFDSIPTDYSSAATIGLPVSVVQRSPSNLNASYTYYAYTANPPGSNPVTVTTLNQVADPLAPAGYRNLTYVSENNPNSITNPVRQIKNNLGQVMYSYDYSTDGSGNILTSTSGPNGLIESDLYNQAGVWLQKRFVIDGHPYTEHYLFSSNLLPTNVIDGNGNAITMAYDSFGNMTYQKDAEGYQTFNTYTAVGVNSMGNNIIRLTSGIDKNNNVRTYSYDGNGNPTQVTLSGVGIISTNSYTFSNGSLIQKIITDANGHGTTFTYDINGNVSSVQEPGMGSQTGTLTTFTYDSNGRNLPMLKVVGAGTAQATTVTYSYTSNNFLQSVQYPDNTSESYQYDPDGDAIDIIDRNGTVSNYSYDSDDRLTDSYQDSTSNYPGSARHTNMQLDALGNTLILTDNLGQKTKFAYNEQGLVKYSIDSAGIGYTNIYDGAKNIITSQDTRGITRTMAYYRNNRLKSVHFSDGTPAVSYTYDGNGNQKSLSDSVGQKNYNYDVLDHLLTLTDTNRNFTITYTYDNVGNRLSMQNNLIPGTTVYKYFANNKLQSITDTDGQTTAYLYDSIKNTQSISYPNGAIAVYFYDYSKHTNRLLTLQNVNSNGDILSTYSCTYDNVGNQVTSTELSGTTSYGYDNMYQLTSAVYPGPRGGVTYTYDGGANRASITQNGNTLTYNNASGNELSSTTGTGGESFTYDADGNVTQRSSGYTYGWDALNRLVKVVTPSGNVTFIYDGEDHRIRKVAPSGTTNYFYDDNVVVAETDGNGHILKSFNADLSVKDQKGNKFFYLYNCHGDAVGLMDSTQSLVVNYSYDAFGLSTGVKTDFNHKRYVGNLDVYSDDDINLQYMWHRWYDPSIGRFISRDPMGFFGGSINLYIYVSNNPLFGVDPTGYFDEWQYMYGDPDLWSQVTDINTWKVALTYVGVGEGIVTGVWIEEAGGMALGGDLAEGGSTVSNIIQNTSSVNEALGSAQAANYLGFEISFNSDALIKGALAVGGILVSLNDILAKFDPHWPVQLGPGATWGIWGASTAYDVGVAIGQGFLNPASDAVAAFDVLSGIFNFFLGN